MSILLVVVALIFPGIKFFLTLHVIAVLSNPKNSQ